MFFIYLLLTYLFWSSPRKILHKCLLLIVLTKIPETLSLCDYSMSIYKQCHLTSLGKQHLILPERNGQMSLKHRILKDSQLFYWSLTVHRQLREILCRCAASLDFFFLIAFQISQKIVSLVLAVSAHVTWEENCSVKAFLVIFFPKLGIKVHYKILSVQWYENLCYKQKRAVY